MPELQLFQVEAYSMCLLLYQGESIRLVFLLAEWYKWLLCFRDIVVVVGGVIPPQDYDFLKEAGAAAIFGPGGF